MGKKNTISKKSLKSIRILKLNIEHLIHIKLHIRIPNFGFLESKSN